MSCFKAYSGKLWSDGGLSDLIVESGIYVSCTVEHNYVISKQFNRAVRVLTLAYEALISLWLSIFFDWCDTNNNLTNIPQDLWKSLFQCYDSYSRHQNFKQVSKFLFLFEIHISLLMIEFRKMLLLPQQHFDTWIYSFMMLI